MRLSFKRQEPDEFSAIELHHDKVVPLLDPLKTSLVPSRDSTPSLRNGPFVIKVFPAVGGQRAGWQQLLVSRRRRQRPSGKGLPLVEHEIPVQPFRVVVLEDDKSRHRDSISFAHPARPRVGPQIARPSTVSSEPKGRQPTIVPLQSQHASLEQLNATATQLIAHRSHLVNKIALSPATRPR